MFTRTRKWGALMLGGATAAALVAVTSPAQADVRPLLALPVINAGGVVNGSDYSASDIWPTTTVAIFGQGFVPTDLVEVYDYSNGVEYYITAGSSWWYDSGNQINATLPNVAPGTASVTVKTANGLTSNSVLITVN